MRKISLFLLAIFVWGSFGGVGFGDVDDITPDDLYQDGVQGQDNSGDEGGDSSDGEGGDPSPDENGQCPTGSNPTGGSGNVVCYPMSKFCEDNGSVYVPELNETTCVSMQMYCEEYIHQKWYEGECLNEVAYCYAQKQGFDFEEGGCVPCKDGEVFDDTAKICFDPSVTPSTIIPNTEIKETDCEKLFQYDSYHINYLKGIVRGGEKVPAPPELLGLTDADMLSPLDILGCAIKTGRIRLWMIPFYIKYLIQLALSLSGLVAVGAVILGGYFYLFGAFADDKDKGKRAIIYGIVGFIVAILSWTIVNIVMTVLTR